MPESSSPSSRRTCVDKTKVVEVFRQIAFQVVKSNPRVEAIYLFGSLAWGRPGPWSDADILVVLKEDGRRMIDRLGEFMLAFSDAPLPADILVWTKEEIDHALRGGNQFLQRALTGIHLA